MYLGRKQLGQEVALAVVATDGVSGSPTWPSSPPVADVWKDGVLVLGGLKLPKIDGQVTGLFQRTLFLDGTYSAGRYEAVVRWRVGNKYGVQVRRWQVVAGGAAGGCVIALTQHELPHARYLVMEAAAGTLSRGKNPQ